MIIGIAIIAYNRPEVCSICVKSILETIQNNKEHEYKIFCCIDTDNNDIINKFKKISNDFNVGLIYHPNVGISLNKSIALHFLRSCDHIFLIEEDVKFIKENWVNLFLKAHKLTNYGLLNTTEFICVQNKLHFIQMTKFDDIKISYYKRHTAQIMSITKETFEKVGYLNPKFKKYGFEHCEYTVRCSLINLHPIGVYPVLSDLFDYVVFQDCNRSLNIDEINCFINYNCNLYNQTVLNRGPIYIGFDQIQPHIQKIFFFNYKD